MSTSAAPAGDTQEELHDDRCGDPSSGTTPAVGGATGTTGEWPGARSAKQLGLTGTDLGLLLMATIWGANFAFVKIGANAMAPLAFNATRVVIGTAVLLAMVAAMRGHWPARREALKLIALGAIGNGIYQACFIEAISRTRVASVAMVVSSTPLWLALLGRWRGTEQINGRGWTGMAISMFGIAMVVLGGAAAGSGLHTWTGDLLAFVGVASWVVYITRLRPLMHTTDPLHLHALTMLGGAMMLLVLGAPALATTAWSAIPPRAWWALAYGSLAAMVFAYLLYYRGVRMLGPTRTSMYGNLQPIVALGAAALLLGEIPTAWQGIGCGFTVAGLLLSRS